MSIPEFSSRAAPGPDSCRLSPAQAQACPSPLAPPCIWVHMPSGKGEPPRSTIQGLNPWVWADGLGRGWGRSHKSHRKNFLRRGSVGLPPSQGPDHRLPCSSFPCPSFPCPRGPPTQPLCAFIAVWSKASVLHLSPVSFHATCLFHFHGTICSPIKSPFPWPWSLGLELFPWGLG